MILNRITGILMLLTPFILVSIMLEPTLGIGTIGVMWGTMGFTATYLAIAFYLLFKDDFWS